MSLAFDDIGQQIVFIVSPQINQQGKRSAAGESTASLRRIIPMSDV
ncbi:hypothetical protein ACVXHA_14235 [Escherichia coli]